MRAPTVEELKARIRSRQPTHAALWAGDLVIDILPAKAVDLADRVQARVPHLLRGEVAQLIDGDEVTAKLPITARSKPGSLLVVYRLDFLRKDDPMVNTVNVANEAAQVGFATVYGQRLEQSGDGYRVMSALGSVFESLSIDRCIQVCKCIERTKAQIALRMSGQT